MLVPDVPERDNNDEIERGLNYLFYGCAIISTIVFILQLVCKRRKRVADQINYKIFFQSSYAVCATNPAEQRSS
jgi:hypothetical protein